MKASELLRRYREGERNFQGVKLRGESLRGKNLSGADFSGADIRGADFRGANLQGSKFRGAKAGLQKHSLALLFFCVFLWGYFFSLFIALDEIWLSSIAYMICLSFLLIPCRLLGIIGTKVTKIIIAGNISDIVVRSLILTTTMKELEDRLLSFIVIPPGLTILFFIALFIATLYSFMSGTCFRCANLTNVDFTNTILECTDFTWSDITCTRWHNTIDLFCSESYFEYIPVAELVITGQGENREFNHLNLQGVNLEKANLVNASFIEANLSLANLRDTNLSGAKLVGTFLDKADLTGATLTGAFIENWGITSHTKLDGIRCRYVFMRLPTKDDPNPRRKPDNWQEEFEDGDFADFIQPIVDTLDLYHNQGVDPRAIAISLKQLAENHPDAELEIVAMEKRGGDNLLLRLATALGANLSQLNAEYFQTYNEIKSLAEKEVKALLAEKDNRIYNLENMIVTALQRPSFYTRTYQNKGDIFMADAPNKQTKNDFSGGNFSQGIVNVDKSQGNRIGGSIYGNHVGGIINNYPAEKKQNLADAAAQIQQLLQQLEQNYPNATEIEKQSALAVTLQQEIKQNPTLKARLINALKEGGIEALKVLFGPIGIPIEMVKGWIEAEAS